MLTSGIAEGGLSGWGRGHFKSGPPGPPSPLAGKSRHCPRPLASGVALIAASLAGAYSTSIQSSSARFSTRMTPR
jgi:hypothetical protein